MIVRNKKNKMKELTYEQYVELFLKIVPQSSKVDSTAYHGRCPICGDSKKDQHKKRFYLLKSRGRYPDTVKCHNCGYATSAHHFFMKLAPDEVKKRSKSWNERDLSDIKKISEGVLDVKINNCEIVNSPDDYLCRYEAELELAKTSLENFFTNYTSSIMNYPEALAYMRGRNIPEYYISEMKILLPKFYNFSKFRYAYLRDYVIIPFLDAQDNKPYYFHSRRFQNLESRWAKYFMCPYRPRDVEVSFFLNEQRVHNDLPVIVAEGTLDSLHLPNCIAVNGIHKITEDLIRKFEYRFGSDIIYAVDNELVDPDAALKVKELLKKGKRVFLWKELSKDLPIAQNIKDFNKLCCVMGQTEFPMHSIEKYTRNNPAVLL